MTGSFNGKVSIPDNVMFRELEGEAVILDLDSERYFGLDEVGTRAWRLLAEGRSVREVNAALLEDYEVDAGTLRDDLDELLAALTAEGLVELRDDDG